MVKTEILCTMWLTQIFGYGSKKPYELIKRFGSAYNAMENGIDELYFGAMSDEIKSAFLNKDLSYVEYILEKCEKAEIKTVCIGEDEYPYLLKEIPNPPVILYYKGDLSLLNDAPFTVVGTRKADEEGRNIVRDFVPTLQKAGFNIVSGFAEGIESFIHKNIFKTTAVLPNGMDIEYPACNRGVKDKIVQNGGLVITEFMLGERAFKGNFYLRNRLLAGISHGVLIIEASKRSGTSITATAAADYGRDVYAVPGSIYNPRFSGITEMLRNHVIPVSSPYEIIMDFERLEKIVQPACNSEKEYGIANLNDEKYDGLNEDERAILSCISGSRIHPDEITVRTGIGIADVNAALISLELSDFVVRLDGNQYIVK